MLKRIICVFFIICMCFEGAGCGNGNQIPGKGPEVKNENNINFLNWISAEEVSSNAIMDVEELYKQKNPGLDIKNIPITWEDTRQQIFSLLASHNAPDVAQIASPWFGQLIATGEVEALDDYIDKTVFNMYDKESLEQYRVDGKLYALPWTDMSIAVFWNVKLLNRVGISPEKLPGTFEEFDKTINKISSLGIDDKGEKIYGFGLPNFADELSVNIFNCFLKGQSTDFIDKSGKITVDDKSLIKLLKWYRYLVDKSIAPKGFAFKDQYVFFANNRIGCFFDGAGAANNIRLVSGKSEEYGKDIVAGPMLSFDGHAGVGSNDHILVMFKQSKNKKKTGKFIEFLCTDKEATGKYFSFTGYIPASARLLSDKLYSGNPMVRVFIEQIPNKFYYGIGKTPYYYDAIEYIGTGINMVTTGKLTPGEGAKYMLDKLNSIFKH